ncbi:DUF192 domain-containing protein [Rhodalgimonas zhirmunskyi]|uniref:DUF192 domain-containing protein n=1 Tax=Rhodalgimonas zhirmunskyi TaxID=2964767 RepID=A0AAJ1X4N4_9RHOB|nr:DUF192 domain-containing protein [Rhodoalgimonas zhirmunskyi]MDQ2092694.1 DUF192 domain-containing protein [Rhodoalgimonas zhirmunskyi]
MGGLLRALTLGGALILGGALAIWPGPSQAAPECREDAVYLRGDWGSARFSVEIADSVGERARGLMHRESLPRSAGMLFVYHQSTAVAFWMKNTLIPLDLLFIDARGVVQKVHARAVPHDLTQIPASDVKAVLEINGGLAKAMGIGVGSEMLHPSFGRDAAWSCD